MRYITPTVLIFLTACSGLEEEGKEQVARQLIDPSSAQFRDVEVLGSSLVCGEVNGKNRMGGYVGFQTFAAVKAQEGEWMVTMDDPSIASTSVRDTIQSICDAGRR